MLSENERIDGSWELTIFIPDNQGDVKVRVKGDIHIGGVMHKAVESLQRKQDWSDHMLWWPDKNIWLSHTRTTLDQYGVQSNSKLELIKVHNNLFIMLPSLHQISVPVNFSTDIFSVVIRICKELNIRFPEELSVQLPLMKEDLKSNHTLTMMKSRLFAMQNSENSKSTTKELPTPEPLSPTSNFNTLKHPLGTLNHYSGTLSPSGGFNKSLSSQIPQSSNSLLIEGPEFSDCMKMSAKSVFDNLMLLQPKNLIQKARMNCTWLDSSRSLMEQGINADYKKPIYIRFKFHAFYDLNTKYDSVRIHQLFEQAKWDLISGRLDATEDEMVVFSALQLQAELQTEISSEDPNLQTKSVDCVDSSNVTEDEVDQMISELEEMCLGDQSQIDGQMVQEPRLEGSLRVCRVNKLGMKTQKRLWVVLQKQKLNFYASKDEASHTLNEIEVSSCQIKPEVNVSSNKFFIKITTSGRDEFRFQFDNKDDYANWMAALRLMARRKTLTNKTLFQKEINNIMDVLRLQTPAPQPVLTKDDLNNRLKELNDYLPEKIAKKSKSKDYLRNRIGESHANVRLLSLLDAKLKYIQAWQRLENFGITHVLVKFDNSNKDDVIGIGSNRIVVINQNTGDVTATYYCSDMRSWNINWDAEKVILDFKAAKLVFKPLSTNCKTVIEFIGGYVFLNQRNPEKNQELNVKFFHKLTGVIS